MFRWTSLKNDTLVRKELMLSSTVFAREGTKDCLARTVTQATLVQSKECTWVFVNLATAMATLMSVILTQEFAW